MSENSSPSTSENASLTNTNNLCIKSCNAATQTPEMRRHAITTQTSLEPSSRKSSFGDINGLDMSSVVVLRVDKGFTEDVQKEAKALAIPDVVVEYIKDTYGLTENGEIPNNELGKDNLGFEHQGGMIKCPSNANLKIQEQDGANLNSQELRKCYSMPRNVSKGRSQDDTFQMHVQPPSPRLQRLNVANEINRSRANSTTLSVLSPNGHSFVAPPSPNFGYRPLESETSAVYTIIKTCLNTNTVKEIHLLNAMASSDTSTPGIKRKFEYATNIPPEVERKQRNLQCCTDAFSAMFFIPGLFITIFTPLIIAPMLLLPVSYFYMLALFFAASGTLGILTLTFSGLLGNLVWYYDENSKKLRLRLHCGRGPRLRFWGNGFYAWSDAKLLAKEEAEHV